MSNGRPSLDGSFPVSLKPIDSKDLEFPRLVDLKYEAEDSSKILIKLLNGSQGPSLLEVSGSDTIAEVKKQAIRHVKARESAMVEFSGKILEDEETLLECGIVSGAELSLLWHEVVDGKLINQYTKDGEGSGESTEEYAPRGADITFEVERRDLTNKARARILYQWDGFMSDRQMLGLPLYPNEFVMIGRIVNQDWYEGYLPADLNKHGYIPRSYVRIESIYDPEFGKALGPVSQGLPLSAPVSTPLQPRRRQFLLAVFVDPVVSLFSRKTLQQTRTIAAAGYMMPNPPALHVPPSPFPPKPPVPSMDLLEHGSRVRLNFHLEQLNPNNYPTITAILSLVSAPQTRISHVTVELHFEHDVIIELEPKREETNETEVWHSNSVTNDTSLKGGTNQGPAGVNLKVGHTVSKAVDFSRRTRGTIIGDGEGSSTAYWVMSEDPGEGGRFGLDSQQKMWVKLHARPVRVDYQVNAKMVTDDGGTGRWFGSKRLSSGRQRFYFRS